MFAFSRPGGNTNGGSAAPRVRKEIQQAWWTGWKKFHRMKWQTVILANGMTWLVSRGQILKIFTTIIRTLGVIGTVREAFT